VDSRPAAAEAPTGKRVVLGTLRRFLPPARLLWIALVVLGAYGVMVLHGLGVLPLILLPLVAVGTDLAFQSVRFPKLRTPDAALVTGLLVALVLPPVVPLVLAGAVTFAGIGIRHALRFRGHPFLNPAVSAVVLGALAFGLAPAWWVSVGPYGEVLMIGLGLLLMIRSPGSWRIALGFFTAYGLGVGMVHLLLNAPLNSSVLFLEVADPAMIFFGLYMVTEPRTSPSDPAFQALYGAGAGLGAATLSVVMPSIGSLVGLLLVNLAAAGFRVASTLRDPRPARQAKRAPRRASLSAGRPQRWPVAYRASAVFFVLVVVIGAAAISSNANPQPIGITAPPGGAGGGSGGGGGLTDCSHDNPTIPASTLASLHQMLGPSVILSDNPNTGVVVFYDPVNHVTVTEYDLYEDYGYAEFNGDDYAVSGCHP
jgi:Na+-translocating ferredoxin:NAD+ oxidoreductase RnfD subunit